MFISELSDSARECNQIINSLASMILVANIDSLFLHPVFKNLFQCEQQRNTTKPNHPRKTFPDGNIRKSQFLGGSVILISLTADELTQSENAYA